jgi:glutamate--cysteine ligase
MPDSVSLDFCRDWIARKVFPLQPDSYRDSYPGFPGAVGIEIEMLPVRVQPGVAKPERVTLQGAKNSLAACLRKMAAAHGWMTSEGTGSDAGLLMAVKLDQEDQLTFEPGGQLEFSSRPYHCLSEVISRTNYIQTHLDKELLQFGGVELLQVGLNPWHGVDEIGLQMNKSRYVAMNEFFSNISPFGPQMMRQTCTVQVNLDFGPTESTMAKRFLSSMLIAPVSGAIFNYSACERGVPTGVTGYRQRVWRHLDPTRTDVPDLSALLKNLNKEACVQTWFDFLRKSRVVFATSLGYKVMNEPFTWEQWVTQGIDGVYPDQRDFETHLSLLFPEVRARGFLELRSVDCQSRVWQFAPAAWWTGLLYSNEAVDQVLDLMTPYASKINALLKKSEYGLSDPEIASLAKKLAKIALDGLSRLPGCYFGGGALKTLGVFSDHFIERGRVPASDLLDEFSRRGVLDLECFKRVEAEWRQTLDRERDPATLSD